MAESKVAIARQFFVAASAALTTMSSGCWTGWPSPSIPKLAKRDAQLVLDGEEISWMVAMVDIGVLVSPLPTGYMMDRFGRKKVIICAGLLSVLSWLLTAVAYNAWFLCTARFLAGLANGISLTVLPIYLGEIASVSIRGALSTMLNLLLWMGISLEFLIGPFVSFKELAYISFTPSILLLLTFPFMPESPYFLSMKDRDKDTLKVLHWLRGSCGNSTEQEIVDIKERVDQDRENKRGFRDIVSNSGNRRAVLITLGLSFFQKFLGSFCLVAYSSTTLPPDLGFFGPSEVMVLFAVVNVLTNLLITQLLDRWGRRPLLLFSAAGTTLLRGFSAIYYFFDRETSFDATSFTWVPYVCVVLSGVTQPGMGSIPFTLQGELFPTFLKSQAAALCTLVLAVSGFLVDKLYATLDNSIGVHVNYWFFCVNGILCFIFIFVFVFETKGKSFTEIQIILRKSKDNPTTSHNTNKVPEKRLI